MKRLAATICLVLHVLLAAAGPAIDARAHDPDARGGVRPQLIAAGGARTDAPLHLESCGLCRALQTVDVPPPSPLAGRLAADGRGTPASVPAAPLASVLLVSAHGARAPPV